MAIEMASVAETFSADLAMVALLDPRTLPPLTTALPMPTMLSSIALTRETMPDESRYAGCFDELTKAAEKDHATIMQRFFHPQEIA